MEKSLDIDRFVARYPRLYHMAEAGTWQSISDHGLLSATAALDVSSLTGEERVAFEGLQRTRTLKLPADTYGSIPLRDQATMPPDRLAKALTDGATPEQWYRLINGKVFFWADEDRLIRMLRTRAHQRRLCDVLTLDTARLVNAHLDRLWLCHMNSSSTWPTPHTRGADVFQPISRYPALRPVVEVAVDYSVPSVADYVVAVRRMRGAAVLAP